MEEERGRNFEQTCRTRLAGGLARLVLVTSTPTVGAERHPSLRRIRACADTSNVKLEHLGQSRAPAGHSWHADWPDWSFFFPTSQSLH
eukprot:746615-Hanusia_phi.AAC.1